ncbi:MAG: YkgJ family cysteine cluster protein [Myxococcota bacterium]|jgi:Fe-S-cluster containining protein|nr:YkgJ family cysteine cluster protein [Myxococcota bacterium]
MPRANLPEDFRFACQRCSRCCITQGNFQYVYLTGRDVQRLAELLELDEPTFLERYCLFDGQQHYLIDGEDGRCCFLTPAGLCQVQEAKPTQCHAWPFVPGMLDDPAIRPLMADRCPGIGKGPRYSSEEIEERLRWYEEWFV